jgi:hypothetical protein
LGLDESSIYGPMPSACSGPKNPIRLPGRGSAFPLKAANKVSGTSASGADADS